ncbi:phage major capsid protein, partial [Pseudomonas viridiflava]
IKGGAVVGYIGSDEDMPATDMQFDDLKLSSKKLAALVPISNDLLSYSGTNPNVDKLVVNDLTASVGMA